MVEEHEDASTQDSGVRGLGILRLTRGRKAPKSAETSVALTETDPTALAPAEEAPVEAAADEPAAEDAAEAVSAEVAAESTVPDEAADEADAEPADSVDVESDAADADTTDATAEDEAAATEADEDEAAANETDEAAASTGSGSRRRRSRRGGGNRAEKAEKAAKPAPEPIDLSTITTTSLLFVAPDLPPMPDPVPAAEPAKAEEASGNRRTRTRNRGGNGSAAEEKQSNETPRKQRQKSQPELITEPQKVKGSTRLEAKKQRRRDGRDAGRRRSVITESEFLARRESVDRVMAVRSHDGVTDIGVLEDGILVEYYQARSQNVSLIGNVYLGRVQNVLPSMEAAFVDIGRGRNAVLYSGEVDWSAAETNNQPRKIENALKAGDKVLVQVTKDPVGHKGARLTSQISLPGRYLVYVPNGSMHGISRKLPDTERSRLKAILKSVLPEHAGVIVRTAAEGASEEQLTRDVTRLQRQWEQISAKSEHGNAPQLLHSEPDLLIKIIRDVFNEDFTKMVISGSDAKQVITEYLGQVAPDLLERVEEYQGDDLFSLYRVNEQIQKALDRKVWLPSGGSLVIDRTEAMTVVDVNTGKFVGSGGNLEETVTRNNLEAAEEIVRQLRLRDIGGIIVIDFIDMVLENNRDLVLRRLVECLARDRTKHQVAEVTSLGLVQMTRKKIGVGLSETITPPAPVAAQNESQGSRRSGRNRNKQSQQQQPAPATPNPATHALTEDVKHAVAQIVAGTLAASHTTPKSVDAPTPEAAETQTPAEDLPTEVLGVPLPPARRAPRRAKAAEVEQLLESVIEALPEPKEPAPKSGRGSRRVSVAAIRPDAESQ